MSIRYYEQHADEFFQRTVDADMATTRARFAALVRRTGHILDAGCGSGRDARAFHELGFEVTAIEAAAPLAELARQYTGLPVQVMTFDQITWRERFDGVWACASLLHVPRSELTAAVRCLRDSLVLGGSLFMSFKYGSGEREVAGRRFTDLDEAGAQRLLSAVGGLELLSSAIDEDLRAECAGQRWLGLLCRRF